MASPYSPPSARVENQNRSVPPRILHVVLAAASGLVANFAIMVAFLVSDGDSLLQIDYAATETQRTLGLIIGGAGVTGLLLLPFRRVSWPLAVLLGPIIAFVVFCVFSVALKQFVGV